MTPTQKLNKIASMLEEENQINRDNALPLLIRVATIVGLDVKGVRDAKELHTGD